MRGKGHPDLHGRPSHSSLLDQFSCMFLVLTSKIVDSSLALSYARMESYDCYLSGT